MPLYVSLWVISPSFDSWSIDRSVRMVYTPTGYFDLLFERM